MPSRRMMPNGLHANLAMHSCYAINSGQPSQFSLKGR